MLMASIWRLVLYVDVLSFYPDLWLVNIIFHISFNPIEHLIKEKTGEELIEIILQITLIGKLLIISKC
jgi:hypothetical protein